MNCQEIFLTCRFYLVLLSAGWAARLCLSAKLTCVARGGGLWTTAWVLSALRVSCSVSDLKMCFIKGTLRGCPTHCGLNNKIEMDKYGGGGPGQPHQVIAANSLKKKKKKKKKESQLALLPKNDRKGFLRLNVIEKVRLEVVCTAKRSFPVSVDQTPISHEHKYGEWSHLRVMFAGYYMDQEQPGTHR